MTGRATYDKLGLMVAEQEAKLDVLGMDRYDAIAQTLQHEDTKAMLAERAMWVMRLAGTSSTK